MSKAKKKASVIERVLLPLDFDHRQETAKMGKVLQEEKVPEGTSPSGKKEQASRSSCLKGKSVRLFTKPSKKFSSVDSVGEPSETDGESVGCGTTCSSDC